MGGDVESMAKLQRENNDALDTDPPPSCSPSLSSTQQPLSLPSRVNPEEEGVLRDILEELDRERTKRAELEAQIRVLTDSIKNLQDDDEVKPAKVVSVSYTNAASLQRQHQLDASKEELEDTTDADADAAASRHKLIALEAQVQGLHQLVDALTSGKPALSRESSWSANDGDGASTAAGIAASVASLPLHTLRLLEIIPWEAHEHIFGTEVLYEWQFMVDADRHTWQSQLKHFPFATNLPVVAPESVSVSTATADGSNPLKTSRSSKDRSLLEFLAGASSATSTSKGDPPVRNKGLLGTFTDEHLSCTYNLEAGYALPSEGTWEWIGGWRVVVKKRTALSSATAPSKAAIDDRATTHLDCDAEGWSYASDPLHFSHSPELVWDSPFDHQHQLTISNDGHAGLDFEPANDRPKADAPVRKFRRRKWIRRRMLVDYPFRSERTKQYLKILRENARLSVSLDKVSTQLVETKTRLTETEAELMKTKSELLVKDALLLRQSSTHNGSSNGDVLLHGGGSAALKSAVMGSVEGGNKVLHDILSSKSEMGSKLSQWMHSTTARKGSEDLSTTSHDPTAVNSAGGGDSIDGTAGEENGNGGSGGSVGAPARGDELGDSQHSRFDWKKIGRGSLLLERLAKGHHRASDASTIATVRSSGSASVIPEEDMEGDGS
jgi:hypothetical protein